MFNPGSAALAVGGLTSEASGRRRVWGGGGGGGGGEGSE